MSYQLLFSGSSIEAMLLEGILKDQGVFPIVKDRHTSGVLAGFYGGEVVQVHVKQEDLERAKELLEAFQANKDASS
jgi:hypothetical protein